MSSEFLLSSIASCGLYTHFAVQFMLVSTWFDYAHQPTLTSHRSPADAQPPPELHLFLQA
ncbi:MAG TPA: hypothetical protein VFC92_07625 [Bacteroidales bacterium]|nr:hypothetical protein [Bacteroidales bacterium]